MKSEPYEVTGLEEITLPDELKYIIVEKGTGRHAKIGDIAKVHYTGYFFLPNTLNLIISPALYSDWRLVKLMLNCFSTSSGYR